MPTFTYFLPHKKSLRIVFFGSSVINTDCVHQKARVKFWEELQEVQDRFVPCKVPT